MVFFRWLGRISAGGVVKLAEFWTEHTWHLLPNYQMGLHQKWPFKMMFLLNLPCPLGHWAIGWMPGDHARSSEPPGACALLRASLQGGEVTFQGVGETATWAIWLYMISWYHMNHMAVPWKSPTLIGELHHTNIYNHIIVGIVCKVSSKTNYLADCFEIFVLLWWVAPKICRDIVYHMVMGCSHQISHDLSSIVQRKDDRSTQYLTH